MLLDVIIEIMNNRLVTTIKKFGNLVFLLVLVFVVVFRITIHAQESGLSSYYIMGIQYPWTKKFKVTVVIKPRNDIQKIKIVWSPSDIVEVSPSSYIIELKNNTQEIRKDFTVKPLRQGDFILHAGITYYSGATTYVDSIDIPIKLDSYLRLPPGENYYIYVAIYYIVIFLITFLVIWGLFKLCRLVCYEYIPRWIKNKTAQPI